MKLLVVTQVLDEHHPILGFFVRWVEELSKHAESVVVIASLVGTYKLPANVTVHSLGKDIGLERNSRALRLPALALALRDEYDTVFVHMIPEFVIAGGIPWKLMGKRVALWYNHTVANPWLSLAVFLSDRVFHTSPFAATARFKKAIRMPAGIDTGIFTPSPSIAKIPGSVYFQGRVAPAKNVHVLLEAFALAHKKGVAKKLTIVGPEDVAYVAPLKEKYKALIDAGAISFFGPRPHHETPALFASHSVSVNLTERGNYDKTVLESLACGTPAIVASDAFDDIVESRYRLKVLDANVLTEALGKVLVGPFPAPHELSERVIMKHSLVNLGTELARVLKKP